LPEAEDFAKQLRQKNYDTWIEPMLSFQALPFNLRKKIMRA